jgi:hypothetical protein
MRTTIKGILLSTVIVSLSGPCLRKGLAAEVVRRRGRRHRWWGGSRPRQNRIKYSQ